MGREKTLLLRAAQIIFHGLMIMTLAAVGVVVLADFRTVGMLIEALQSGQFNLSPYHVLLHMGLAACTWAFGVIGYLYIKQLRQQPQARVVKLSRGTALTETLIILVPFLLLTSGLAQMSMMNIAGMLSDLGAYQGARAAVVWLPEQQIRRVNMTSSCDLTAANSVCNRVRAAVAFAVAPSAPSNFYLGSNPNPGNEDFKRARGAMAAAFGMGSSTGSSGYNSANRSTGALGGGQKGTLTNVSFSEALDTHSFSKRAARKVTNAFVSLEELRVLSSGNNVGVSFTYKYQLVFPWFAWIFGQQDGFGGAYFLPIKREYTLPAQPDMR